MAAEVADSVYQQCYIFVQQDTGRFFVSVSIFFSNLCEHIYPLCCFLFRSNFQGEIVLFLSESEKLVSFVCLEQIEFWFIVLSEIISVFCIAERCQFFAENDEKVSEC